MNHLVHEFHVAFRRLARNPGFALAVLATLGLGLGATVAIFGVVRGVILQPLPYPRADRLVVIRHKSASGSAGGGVPSAAWFQYRDRSRTIQQMAVYVESSTSIAGTGRPLEVGVIEATPSLLSVLGVSPVLGRDLTEADSRPGAPPVLLVTHRFWVRHLGADPAAVGRPVFPGDDAIVVGVLPEGFTFERPPATVVFGNPFHAPDLIVPLKGLERSRARFGNFMYQGVARLADGATIEDARIELESLMFQAAAAYPGAYTPAELRESGLQARIMRLKDAIVGELGQMLWILFAAIGFVFLIAVANVASLFLARAEARRSEMAIRRALGAGRRAVARAYLTESLLLALGGGALGVGVAASATGVLLRLAPTELPRAAGVGIDGSVLGFAALLSALVGLAFGALPLLQRELRPFRWLGSSSRGLTDGVTVSRTREVLLVSQVALAVVLLLCSGLLIQTFLKLSETDPGFDGSHSTTLKVALSRSLLRAAGRTERAADLARSRFMLDLTRRLEEVPGVELAGFTADLPLDEARFYDHVAVEGRLPTGLDAETKVLRVFIGPKYLAAIGARMASGRELRAGDFADQPRVAVVNRAFAEAHFPGESALGHRLMQWYPDVDPTTDVWYTIVGVVENIRETDLMAPPGPTVYLPTAFLPQSGFAMSVSNLTVVAKVSGDPLAMLPRLQATVEAAYPELPVNGVSTLDQLTARSFQRVSFAMTILLTAGLMALALGAVGTYGTVAYLVGRRAREFGVRMALGATAGQVRREVVWSGARMGTLGIGAGIALGLLASRAVRSLLFGVSAADPAVYAAACVVVFGAVIAACLAPAARASAVDPVEAMRTD